jgi:hypothetical protein
LTRILDQRKRLRVDRRSVLSVIARQNQERRRQELSLSEERRQLVREETHALRIRQILRNESAELRAELYHLLEQRLAIEQSIRPQDAERLAWWRRLKDAQSAQRRKLVEGLQKRRHELATALHDLESRLEEWAEHARRFEREGDRVDDLLAANFEFKHRLAHMSRLIIEKELEIEQLRQGDLARIRELERLADQLAAALVAGEQEGPRALSHRSEAA